MSTLVVIGYYDMFKAEEMRLKLWKMQKDYLVDLEDAVVAVKDEKGKVRLHRKHSVTWGSLSFQGLVGQAFQPVRANISTQAGWKACATDTGSLE